MTIFTVLEHKSLGGNLRKNLRLIVQSENDEIFEILLFNRGFLESLFKVGQKFYIYSKFNYSDYTQMWSCSNFDSESFSYNPERFNKIMPIYSLSEGLTSKKISSYVKKLLFIL